MTDLKYSVADQFPRHLANEQLLIAFFEAYYEWMERDDNPYGVLKGFKKNFDLEESHDAFLEHFKSEFLESFPKLIHAEKKHLVEYIRDFYLSRGTEKSFKFLFKILFDENVAISYPKDLILRVSDGKWVADEKIIYTTDTSNLTLALSSEVRQERIVDDIFKVGSGTVRDVKIKNVGGYRFAEITVADVVGDFDFGFPIVVGGSTEYLYPIISNFKVVDGGLGYTIGDKVLIDPGKNFFMSRNLSDSLSVDMNVTTLFEATDIEVALNGVPLAISEYFIEDGRYLNVPNGNAGDLVEILLPSVPGIIEVRGTGTNGEIIDFLVEEYPVGYNTSGYSYSIEGGSGAVLELVNGSYANIPGYYKNHDGHVSSDRYIQDSDYYQEFSYLVETGIPIEQYSEILDKTIHPAGTKFFGSISSIERIDLSFRTITEIMRIIIPIFVTTFDPDGETLFKTAFKGYPLGAVPFNKDKYKHTGQEWSTPVKSIDHWSVEELRSNKNIRSSMVKRVLSLMDFDASDDSGIPEPRFTYTDTPGPDEPSNDISWIRRISVSGNDPLLGPLEVDDYFKWNVDDQKWEKIVNDYPLTPHFVPDTEIIQRLYGSTISEIESGVLNTNAKTNWDDHSGISTLYIWDQTTIDNFIDAF